MKSTSHTAAFSVGTDVPLVRKLINIAPNNPRHKRNVALLVNRYIRAEAPYVSNTPNVTISDVVFTKKLSTKIIPIRKTSMVLLFCFTTSRAFRIARLTIEIPPSPTNGIHLHIAS